MKRSAPVTDLDPRFSSADAAPTAWNDANRRLEEAEIFWISTVRPNGQPHVAPLIGIWSHDRFQFCTGADERKAKNLATNTRCVVTTGCNSLSEGIDVVVEGEVLRIRDDSRLQTLADVYAAKYEDWHFTVRNGMLADGDVEALAFEVVPAKAFAFAKGEPFGQTRYHFSSR